MYVLLLFVSGASNNRPRFIVFTIGKQILSLIVYNILKFGKAVD